MRKTKLRPACRAVTGTIAMLLVGAFSAWASFPETIRYQARLGDSAGVPLQGTYSLDFAIYDALDGGTMLWTEGPRPVDLQSGAAELLLGEVTPLPSLVFTSADRWLKVTVDGAVLSPRQRLSSMPYAHVADRLGDMTQAQMLDLSPPVGGIIQYFGAPSTLPPNWRVCDGSVVNDPQSPLNGVAVPDLRNRFTRGEGDPARDIPAAGVVTGGSDTVVAPNTSSAGSHQHSTLSGQTGKITTSGLNPGLTNYNVYSLNVNWSDNAYLVVGVGGNNEGQHYHSLDGSGTATSAGTHDHGMNSHSNIPGYAALHFIIRIR